MKTRKLKTLALFVIAIIIVLGSLSISNADTTKAKTSELGYLKITRNRTIPRTVEAGKTDNVTYRHQIKTDETRNVWKLVTCEVDNETKKVTETNLI